MADQIPETAYERATQEARDKERLDWQKLLVSLPRGKPEQGVLALMAEKLADLREEQQDALLLLATEDLDTVRDRLVQHLRGLDAKAARLFKIAQVGAKEGTAAAQWVFIPAPVYMDLDDEEARTLEKFRKEQEAAKKKETGKSKSAWKMGNAKKSVPYGYNYGKAGYSGGYGYGSGFGGASGLGGWALQKLWSSRCLRARRASRMLAAAARRPGAAASRRPAWRRGWPPTGCITPATAVGCWATGREMTSASPPMWPSTSRRRWPSRPRGTRRRRKERKQERIYIRTIYYMTAF
jgi:hypothetical protein